MSSQSAIRHDKTRRSLELAVDLEVRICLEEVCVFRLFDITSLYHTLQASGMAVQAWADYRTQAFRGSGQNA